MWNVLSPKRPKTDDGRRYPQTADFSERIIKTLTQKSQRFRVRLSIPFLRRHYPDQVQGSKMGCLHQFPLLVGEG